MVTDKTTDGTPVLAQEQNGNSRIVFSGSDKATYLFGRQNDAFIEQNKIKDADLASAAIAKDKVFIAFVRKAGEKRKIYFLKQT
jgi:hypothetical protein